MNYVILRNISNVVTMKRYPNHATDDSMVDNQIGIITTPNLKVSNKTLGVKHHIWDIW